MCLWVPRECLHCARVAGNRFRKACLNRPSIQVVVQRNFLSPGVRLPQLVEIFWNFYAWCSSFDFKRAWYSFFDSISTRAQWRHSQGGQETFSLLLVPACHASISRINPRLHFASLIRYISPRLVRWLLRYNWTFSPSFTTSSNHSLTMDSLCPGVFISRLLHSGLF